MKVEYAMDLLASGGRTGYLLKTRVTDVGELVDTLKRVERGGSALDPVLMQQPVAARRADDPLAVLTSREREVLALIAEGRSNARIWQALWVTEGTVEKHVRSIMMKRHLPETAEVHKTGPVQFRCLIVDDDEEFLKLAHALLKRDGVTGAGVAHNSAEAVQRTRPCGRTADLRDRLSPAEVFSEVLEHRWYMSEAAARDVGTTAATRHYIEQVLSAVPARLDETTTAWHRSGQRWLLDRTDRRSWAIAGTVNGACTRPVRWKIFPPPTRGACGRRQRQGR